MPSKNQDIKNKNLKVGLNNEEILIDSLNVTPVNFREVLESNQTTLNRDNAIFKNGLWDIYYILLHCKIAKPITIEKDIEIIPFGEYTCNNYFTIIEDLVENIIGLPEFNESPHWEYRKNFINKVFKENKPLGLLVFRNIHADNEFEVYEKTKDYASDIILTLSAVVSSSIELKGWAVEGNNKGFKTVHSDIYFYHYKQGYMDPKELEEIIKDILKEIKGNLLIKFALKYENEALSERNPKFRLIKRWSALEYIAEDHLRNNPKNKMLSKEEINRITEFTIKNIIKDESKEIKDHIRNKIGQINHKNAKDKIREFLSDYNYSLKTIVKDKDILDFIYQKRNCITHNGGCNKYKELKGKCEGPAYCRNSELDLEELNLELSDILKHVIGKYVNTIFKHETKITDDIKKIYKL